MRIIHSASSTCADRVDLCAQVDLQGVMVWWNVQLNAISLVNLVMVRYPPSAPGLALQDHLIMMTEQI